MTAAALPWARSGEPALTERFDWARKIALRALGLGELTATTYQACSAALAKLGEPEAAWIAADRAMAAAERAGNPLLVAAGAFRLVFVFLAASNWNAVFQTGRGGVSQTVSGFIQ